MGLENKTSWTEFILVSFSDLPHVWVPLFVGFLLLYLVAIGGNILVMATIYSDSHLHKPMYFFLSNLSFVDISYISITYPNMLVSFFLQNKRITLQQCLLQVYFFISMIVTEFFLLTIMSFDRYVAICTPLHYTMLMSKAVCLQLTSGCWILGFIFPIFHIVFLSTFTFCKSNEINHFFCEITALLKLSCTNTNAIERMTFVLCVILMIFSCLLILVSYLKIILAILKIQNGRGRYKAFSTCASHLTVVILFYGVLTFVYMRPASMYSMNQSKISSIIYGGVIPMCNPIIYTLKNKEFKDALERRRCGRYYNKQM